MEPASNDKLWVSGFPSPGLNLVLADFYFGQIKIFSACTNIGISNHG